MIKFSPPDAKRRPVKVSSVLEDSRCGVRVEVLSKTSEAEECVLIKSHTHP